MRKNSMAKLTAAKKTPAAVPAEKKQVKVASKAKSSPNGSALSIEKACESSLELLRKLDLEPGLQADIQWCLGSYRADGNPIGLFQMAERALAVFEREKAAKNKGVSTKIIGELAKALKP